MKNVTFVFDLQGTLVKRMRPPTLNGKVKSIRKLKRAANSLILFTGARKTETLNILKKLRLYPKIFKPNLIFTADDDLPRKPNAGVFKLIKRKIKPKKVIYVGDSKKDWQTARNAKVDFIYVGKAKIGNWQIKNLDDLPKLVTKLLI